MPEPGPAFELGQIVGVLVRWKAVMALVVLAAVGIAALYSYRLLPKVYQAVSTVNVGGALASAQQAVAPQSAGQATDLQGVVNAATTIPQANLQTYQWEITSPPVLDLAVSILAKEHMRVTTAALADVLTAGTVADTSLVTISVDGTDPAAATAIANAVATAFIQAQQGQARQHLGQALSFLEQQAGTVEADMEGTTADLTVAQQQAAQAVHAASAIASDQQVLQQETVKYQAARQQLQVDIAGEQALKSQLSQLPATVTSKNVTVQTSPTSTGSSGTTTASDSQGTSVQVSPNPVYQAIAQQLAQQVVAIAQQQTLVTQLLAQENALQSQIRARRPGTAAPEAKVTALQARLATLKTAYATLTGKITETEIAQAVVITDTGVSIWAYATRPTLPIAPRKRLYVGMAFLLGLITATALAFFLEQMDHTIRSVSDVRRVAGVPTMAVIPYARH